MVRLIPDLVRDKFQRDTMPARQNNGLRVYCTILKRETGDRWLLRDGINCSFPLVM